MGDKVSKKGFSWLNSIGSHLLVGVIHKALKSNDMLCQG